ncbi:hypothetical protein EAF00_010571 [Botryotinia globosa]|nr:hypothetical protein EAF00_010571 [Botryotinia globosa]
MSEQSRYCGISAGTGADARRLATWRANWVVMRDQAYNGPNISEALGEMKGSDTYRLEEDD